MPCSSALPRTARRRRRTCCRTAAVDPWKPPSSARPMRRSGRTAARHVHVHPPRTWSGRPDLNRRPPHPQCDALPDCATPRTSRCARPPWILQPGGLRRAGVRRIVRCAGSCPRMRSILKRARRARGGRWGRTPSPRGVLAALAPDSHGRSRFGKTPRRWRSESCFPGPPPTCRARFRSPARGLRWTLPYPGPHRHWRTPCSTRSGRASPG